MRGGKEGSGTFDADDVVADLLGDGGLVDEEVEEVVDGVDAGVHRLEALDLAPDRLPPLPACILSRLDLATYGQETCDTWRRARMCPSSPDKKVLNHQQD